VDQKTENSVDGSVADTYTVSMESEKFSSKIIDIAQEHNMTLTEAVVLFCDYHDITLKRAAKLLSPKVIAMIAEEEDIHGLDLT
jgi:hypothetical protein